MRTELTTTVVSLVAAGAFVFVLAGSAHAGIRDSGWQSVPAPGTSTASHATDVVLGTDDNNGNS